MKDFNDEFSSTAAPERDAKRITWGQCALVYACALLSGCATIPERDVEYQRNWLHNAPALTSSQTPHKSDYLDKARTRPATHGTVLLENGYDALLTRLHLIGAANESIDIQTFIWRDDPVTRAIFAQLEQAARRGVRVRILIDALNHIGDPQAIAAMASAHRNIEIALHRPLSSNTSLSKLNWLESLLLKMRRLNRRMHNKIFIADGLVGIVGGRNYEDKYFDRGAEMIFNDRDVLATGPAVSNMAEMFEAYWNHHDSVFAGQFRDVAKAFSSNPKYGLEDSADLSNMLLKARETRLEDVRPNLKWKPVADAVFSWDDPGKLYNRIADDRPTLGSEIYDMILSARSEILLQTPYLIYQRSTARQFQRLKKANPKLKIKISSNSLAAADHVNVYAISFKDRQKLYKNAGMEIYEFKPHPKDWKSIAILTDQSHPPRMVVHAKSLVVDGKAAKIGSHNFDPRSAKYNTECGLIVVDPDFAQAVRRSILRDMAPGNSWIVGRKLEKENFIDRGSRLLGGVSNMIPFFDIWPYRYTSNFALIEGMPELPDSRHPDFYESYTDVGQFPEVGSLYDLFQTHMFKIFVGWSRPFM